MKPFYKETILQSWKMAIRQRTFWWLAFFASFLGIAPTFHSIFDLFPTDGSLSINIAAISQSDFITSNFVGWSIGFYEIPWSEVGLSDIPLLGLITLVLLIVIFLAVVVVASEGGLIKAIDTDLKGKKITYLQSFRAGVDKFWEIFMLHFSFRLIYLIIFGAVITPLVIWATYTSPSMRLAAMIVSYFILIPTLIVLDIVVRYAVMNIMLRSKSAFAAFDEAWVLFKQNWIISLETALLIFVLLVVYSFVAINILSLLSFVFIGFALTVPTASVAYSIILFTGLVIIAAIIVLAIVIYATFYLAVWTNIFNRLNKEPHYSKVHRVLRHHNVLNRKLI